MHETWTSIGTAVIGGLFSSWLGMWFMRRSRTKKSTKAHEGYGVEPVSIWAMSLGLGFLKSQWVTGTLEIEPGVATFYESLKLPESKGKQLQADKVRLGETRPLEEKEARRINQQCDVLLIELNGHTVQIALLAQDMALVRAALDPSGLSTPS